MKKKNYGVSLLVILLSVFVFLILTGPTPAGAKEIRWRMSTTWPPILQLIEADRYFVKHVNELAAGEMKIEFFEAGKIVPALQVFEAVSQGNLNAAADCPLYWAGKNSVFDLLGSYPFGLTTIDYMVWIYQGGGFELYQEAYGKYGMVYLPHSITPMESGVRGHKPLNSLEDFKGLKVRMPGKTQGKILKEIGGAQVMMATPEIYQALEKGVIDATELSNPSIDILMGMHEVTEFWGTPGWHQPASVLGIMINKKDWDALPPRLQTVLKTAATATLLWSFTFFEHGAIDGTEKFLEKGIKITRLPDADLNKLQAITNKITIENCKENPLFAKVAYSQFKYLKDIANWRGICEPFTYGRNPEIPDLSEIEKYIEK
jgi:TRAP-type mannitol/chloroaromatic compound transport system substrate-binding protein